MHGIFSPDQATTQRRCASCGDPLGGAYCSHCGQREFTGRHTFRTVFFGALSRLLSLERGFLHTAGRLTVAPASAVREYLGGRLAPYTHPVAYLIITFAAFTLTANAQGGIRGEGDRLFTVLALPCIAGVSCLLFWRARLNYTEHLILVMYLVGQIALFFAAIQVVALVAGRAASSPIFLTALGLTILGISIGYFGWAYSRCFDRRPVLAGVGGIATLLGGSAIWLVALAAVLNALRALGGI